MLSSFYLGAVETVCLIDFLLTIVKSQNNILNWELISPQTYSLILESYNQKSANYSLCPVAYFYKYIFIRPQLHLVVKELSVAVFMLKWCGSELL